VTADRLSTIVAALGHPLRVQILLVHTHAEEDLSPTKVASALGLPVGRVSYHYRALANDGLLVKSREEVRRGALEHFYRLEADTMRVFALLDELVDHDEDGGAVALAAAS
jgi:DNA-binding transcriptional ArsR family regulator